MNDYDELKKEVHRVSRAIASKRREIQQLSDELETIEREKEAVRNSSDRAIKEDYNSKYKEHLDALIGPIDSELEVTRQELEAEDEEFKHDFDELTEDNFMEQCTDTQELLHQVQEMSTSLRSKLQDLIGPQLYNNVIYNLKATPMKLEVSDLDRVITYFNECEDEVSEITEKPDFVGDVVKKLEGGLQSFEGGTIKSKGLSVFVSIAFIILLLVMYRYVFPIYVVFIVAIGLFHVFRTYHVYEILLVQKAIEDNIDSINEKLHETAKYEADKARAELQQEHQERVDMLNSKLKSLTEKQQSAVNTSKESFFYDKSSLQAALDGKLTNLDKREADATASKMSKTAELTALTQELNELKKNMDSVFSSQQNVYLNYEKAGESFILNRTFLLDIDDVTQKLVFFNLPEDSSLFLYKDKEEAINLIKLLTVQIRARLHPSCYEIIYYDTVNVGQDCLFFVPESDDKDPSSRLFRIVSSDEDFREVISNYTSEMKSRQKSFRQDGNIDSYNEHMLKIDSLPMPYYFLFALCPSDTVAKRMTAITRAAGMYGIYICTFIAEDSIFSMGSSAKDIIESYTSFFAIQNGKVNNRAKDFILDQYCNKKEP